MATLTDIVLGFSNSLSTVSYASALLCFTAVVNVLLRRFAVVSEPKAMVR